MIRFVIPFTLMVMCVAAISVMGPRALLFWPLALIEAVLAGYACKKFLDWVAPM